MKLSPWIYRARDAVEIRKHIPRNSPVSNVVHTVVGGAVGLGATVGVAALMPKPDPARPGRWDQRTYLDRSRIATTAIGGAMVLTTLGAQENTLQKVALGRGVNPLYFLGVGMAASSLFMSGKFQQAYDQ